MMGNATVRATWTVSRPRFWFYLAGPVLVGAVFGAGSLSELWSIPLLVLFGYFLVPANVLLYGVNDRFDTDTDARNPKKEGREARWAHHPSVRGPLVVALLLAPLPFVVTTFDAWPYLLGFFALAIGYSAPPLRLKTTPFLDSIANGLYILPGAATYATIAGAHPPVAAVLGGWLWTMGMHTFSAIPDIAPDRAAGLETTATVLGRERTLVYCFGCWSGAALVFGTLHLGAGLLLAIYPVLLVVIATRGVAIRRAYWWFPLVNTGVGAVFTLVGLWGLQGGFFG